MPKLVINDKRTQLATFLASFNSFFDVNRDSSFLTQANVNKGFKRLIGEKFCYPKGVISSNGVVLSLTPEGCMTIKLEDGSEIDMHHNFVSTLPLPAVDD